MIINNVIFALGLLFLLMCSGCGGPMPEFSIQAEGPFQTPEELVERYIHSFDVGVIGTDLKHAQAHLDLNEQTPVYYTLFPDMESFYVANDPVSEVSLQQISLLTRFWGDLMQAYIRNIHSSEARSLRIFSPPAEDDGIAGALRTLLWRPFFYSPHFIKRVGFDRAEVWDQNGLCKYDLLKTSDGWKVVYQFDPTNRLLMNWALADREQRCDELERVTSMIESGVINSIQGLNKEFGRLKNARLLDSFSNGDAFELLKGLSEQEVASIFGQPDLVSGSSSQIWTYEGVAVQVDLLGGRGWRITPGVMDKALIRYGSIVLTFDASGLVDVHYQAPSSPVAFESHGNLDDVHVDSDVPATHEDRRNQFRTVEVISEDDPDQIRMRIDRGLKVGHSTAEDIAGILGVEYSTSFEWQGVRRCVYVVRLPDPPEPGLYFPVQTLQCTVSFGEDGVVSSYGFSTPAAGPTWMSLPSSP